KTPTLLSALLAVATSVFITTSSRAASVLLTEDGQPKAVIVLPVASNAGDLSTKTLIAHVKQMSGATLPTITEKELGAIRIEDGRIIPPVGRTTAQTFILLGEGELTHR